MISFSSGGENPHGVKAVTKGQRCAVALWFTLDPLYRELVSFWPTQKATETSYRPASWTDLSEKPFGLIHNPSGILEIMGKKTKPKPNQTKTFTESFLSGFQHWLCFLSKNRFC